MKKMVMSIGLGVLAHGFCAAGQSGNISIKQIDVTEEVYVNGGLRTSRDEVFRPTPNLTNAALICLVSTNGAAFLNLTDLRLQGTNVWFRKWEYGRNRPPSGTETPMYMIESGSVIHERTPEFRLVIGDKTGFRQWEKHMGKRDGTPVDTFIVIKASND
jgi:hypothetical protein